MPTRARFVVLAALLLSGCASTTVVGDGGTAETAAPTETTVPGFDCHFATTVPGGALPQPQCETVPPRPVDSTDQRTTNPWECPDEDYPIAIAATSWAPFTQPPDPIPACQGALSDNKTPDILIPTTAVQGLSADVSLGLAAYRQPGGIFWSTKVALPAGPVPIVKVETVTMTQGFPDQETWRDEQLERICGSGSELLTIRQTDGCRSGSVYGWVTADTAYQLSITLDLSTDQVLEWLETWRVAS